MLTNLPPRTDLALESYERTNNPSSGITKEEYTRADCKVTRMNISEDSDFKKPPGVYTTIRLPDFLSFQPPDAEQAQIIADELNTILPPKGAILVLGLGNGQITPDALGPRAVKHILTTRMRNTLGGMSLREVCAIAPGVLAQTGLESREVLSGLLSEVNLSAIIAIDALAAEDISRLGNTVQLTDTGISPGSGVENARPELSEKTLGIPVIAIGVPTVIDYVKKKKEEKNKNEKKEQKPALYFVTPRDIDLLVERAARLIALGINISLQPTLSAEDLLYLTAE